MAEQAQNRPLREEVAALRQQLAQTQAQVAPQHGLRAPPRRLGEATEADIADKFRSLCSSVRQWVRNRLGPLLNDLDDGVLARRTPPPHGSVLLSYVKEDATPWFLAAASDEHHVIACVMQYLKLALFDKSFYCPLDASQDGDRTIGLLDSICQSMTLLSRGVPATPYFSLVLDVAEAPSETPLTAQVQTRLGPAIGVMRRCGRSRGHPSSAPGGQNWLIH